MIGKEIARYHRDIFNGELKRLRGHPYFGGVFAGGEPDYDRLVARYRRLIGSVIVGHEATVFGKRMKVLLLRSLGNDFAAIGAETGYAPNSIPEAQKNGLNRLANHWGTQQILDNLYVTEYFEKFAGGSWPTDFNVVYVDGILRKMAVENSKGSQVRIAEMYSMGIPKKVLNRLVKSGIEGLEQLRSMTDGQILDVGRIGKAGLARLRAVVPNPTPSEQLRMELFYDSQRNGLREIGLPMGVVRAMENMGVADLGDSEAFLSATEQRLSDYRTSR